MAQPIFLSPPHMGPKEREYLLEAFDSNWIAPLGPHVDAFEREFAAAVGAGHAAALSSGTAALHLALVIGGVGPGDEVVTSTLTFAATANAIRYVGATPVFVDCERQSWNMDPELLAAELEERAKAGKLPKAVIAVDLYGQCPDYARIAGTCARHDVLLLEDAAEALGGSYGERSAGTLGAMGIFSFNGNKMLNCSGGGMLVSDSADQAERARFLATQARDPAPHYQHSQIGFNYRMSNLLAAVGRGQLHWLDERVAARQENRRHYAELLNEIAGIELLPEASWGRSAHWLTCALIDEGALGATRDQLCERLQAENIEARPVWKPMHLQPVFEQHRVVGGTVAEDLFGRGMCLPSGSQLTAHDRERIVRIMLNG